MYRSDWIHSINFYIFDLLEKALIRTLQTCFIQLPCTAQMEIGRTIKITILAFITVMMLWACNQRPSPSNVTKNFLTAVGQLDLDAASALATNETSHELAGIADLFFNRGIGSFRILEEAVTGDEAVVKTFLEDLETEIEVYLIRVEDQWKVDASPQKFKEKSNNEQDSEKINPQEV